MESSGALQSQLLDAENALKVYQDPNAGIDLRNQVQRQWTPVLESAARDTSNQMKDYLSSYLGDVYNYGTSAADLSPQQKMQMMGNQLGGMVGRLNYSSNLGSYLGGKMNEMAQNAMQAWQLGNQAAANAYERLFQRYQLALQMEEAERARRAQAELVEQMYSQGGGGGQTSGTSDEAIVVPDGQQGLDWGKAIGDVAKGVLTRTPLGFVGTAAGGYLAGGEQGLKNALKGTYAPEYNAYKQVQSGLNFWNNLGNLQLPKINIPINR